MDGAEVHVANTIVDNVLNNADLYVSAQVVLDYTFGKGVEMTREEFAAHSKNKKKRKTGAIACGGYYHKGLYELANRVQEKLLDHEALFPRIPQRQKTDRIHPIGILMMSSRKLCRRADIHNIPDDSFKNLINSNQNKGKLEFYYLSMRDVLRKVHEMWGVNLNEQKQVTPDDIVRLFGLLLIDEDLKDMSLI